MKRVNKEYIANNEVFWNQVSSSEEDGRNKFTQAVSHEVYWRATEGELQICLTAAKNVPESWFPPLKGTSVLALASGGGQQGPIFAAHGAKVTVFDFSAGQLAGDRFVAEREGCFIRTVQGDMEKPLPFADNSFELIFNPVSNCYIETIDTLQKECARILKPGGVLMLGFIKEEHSMFEPDFKNEDVLISRHTLPFNPLTDLTEEQKRKKQEKQQPFVFSHTLTEQIGGLLKAGFRLTDLYEDGDGGGLFDKYMKSYVAARFVKE